MIIIKIVIIKLSPKGRYSSVGIATRYRLDSPGFESPWGRDFSHPSRSALGPTQPPVQWVQGLSPRVKRPGRAADLPPYLQCRGHERIGLYLYSPSGSQWPVIGRTSAVTERTCVNVLWTTNRPVLDP